MLSNPANPYSTRLSDDSPIYNTHLICRRAIKGKAVDITKPWETALKRDGITGFHFHDLRHNAASCLLESEATLAQLAEVLGHRTLSLVKR